MTTKKTAVVDGDELKTEDMPGELLNKDTGEIIPAPYTPPDEWPEGFESYDLSYETYEAWDWDSKRMLIGSVSTKREVPMMRKGKQVEVIMLVVKVGGDEYAVWETAQLKPLMEKAYPGMQVAIKFTGMEDLPNGKRIRRFEARTRG